jgi:hypothetical protein
MQMSCYECALRPCGIFKPITPEELATINDLKKRHAALPAGAEIIRAGEDSPELYTRIPAGLSASKRCRTVAGRF